MQDYNAANQKINLLPNLTADKENVVSLEPTKKWENANEIKDYIQKTKRSPVWYRETDKKLQHLAMRFIKLCGYPWEVRRELVRMCNLVITNCMSTLPRTVSYLAQIAIILNKDSDCEVQETASKIVDQLSPLLAQDEYKIILDNLEESFLSAITSLPRKFNGIGTYFRFLVLPYLD